MTKNQRRSIWSIGRWVCSITCIIGIILYYCLDRSKFINEVIIYTVLYAVMSVSIVFIIAWGISLLISDKHK